MARLDTKLECEGAEFLVLGHLLMHRISSYKMYTNMPGYDLVAHDPDRGTVAHIQVKSRWHTGATFFLLKNTRCDFVVIVKLNRGKKLGDGRERPPEFYILPIRALKNVRRTKGWNKIRFSDIPNFETCRDKWHQIRDFLNSA
jgi:hypothetical protein